MSQLRLLNNRQGDEVVKMRSPVRYGMSSLTQFYKFITRNLHVDLHTCLVETVSNIFIEKCTLSDKISSDKTDKFWGSVTNISPGEKFCPAKILSDEIEFCKQILGQN